ncbi:MAG: DUF938 domain-containing protein [Bdellovibrionota bacterium]
MEKPYAPACDRNRQVILEVLKKIIDENCHHLLEIGAGTGQHAVYMAPHFPQMKWVVSDVAAHSLGIKMWLKESNAKNIEGPIRLEIGKDDFPTDRSFQVVFTANTMHIMAWKQVKSMIKLCGKRLRVGAKMCVYGPFNYNQTYTSESNAKFDKFLKARDPQSGIRHFEDVDKAMQQAGFILHQDIAMPAHNHFLIYQRRLHGS